MIGILKVTKGMLKMTNGVLKVMNQRERVGCMNDVPAYLKKATLQSESGFAFHPVPKPFVTLRRSPVLRLHP